ncbi:MAG: UDP-N-acetylmuramate--L-alanine ligase, partial [Lachnospiraceae bacterium]
MKNIKFNDIKHIYFCGIGGISMSGLARVLFEKNFEVSGSDTKANNRTKDLEDRGVKIFVGQKNENISDDIDLFVYTAAIHNDNPEFIAAKEKNIKMMTRAELLGYVMSKFKESIAISGTHGKTTTTSMLSYILLDTNLDPTISVGGIVKKIKGNIYIGKGDTFVTEACEYTNSFLELYPTVGVILNIEEDHLDFFKDLDEIRNSFKNFAKNTSPDGCIIINDKIKNNREITQGFEGNVVRYGTENSDCYATNIRYDALGYPTFDLVHKEETYENVKLCVGGNHNIYNALAAICVAFELGVSIEDIRKG